VKQEKEIAGKKISPQVYLIRKNLTGKNFVENAQTCSSKAENPGKKLPVEVLLPFCE
jgi:hypothetical protein